MIYSDKRQNLLKNQKSITNEYVLSQKFTFDWSNGVIDNRFHAENGVQVRVTVRVSVWRRVWCGGAGAPPAVCVDHVGDLFTQ